jgi:branched-chain amino acid transport system permease protein
VTELLQHLVNGLSLGTIYALVALGYTMVYGVLKLINFAHGDVYMVGAFAGYYLGAVLGANRNPNVGAAALVVIGSMAVCAALGLVVERFAYRPLRHRARLTALITAIGVSFLLEFGFQLNPVIRDPIEFPPGPAPRFFPALVELGPPLELLGATLPLIDVVGFVLAILLMLGLQWIVYRTRFGVAMRAVSFDSQVAGLMGIPVNRVIAWTFALGSALAAAAGIINASSRPRIEPLLGLMSGLKAFVAAVLGGIGSVPGAMAGGLALGFIEEFVAGYTSSQYRDAIAFTVLIIVLLFRPEGLFGKGRVEKV